MAPRAIIPGWTWLTSLAVHGALIGGFGWLAFRTLEPAPPEATQATVPSPDRAAPVDLPAFTQDVTLLSDNAADPVGALPTHAGGTQVARVDTGHDGRGGQATVDERAVHLSDVDERLRLSASVLSRLDRDQVPRVRSGPERESREDRRSTTHPSELTFLSTGPGERAERRTASDRDPSRGALQASPAAVQGGNRGAADLQGDDPRAEQESGRGGRIGTMVPSPGVGVHDGVAGSDHRASAAVRTARPDVTLAAVQVEALKRGRPSDTVDSDQEVATTIQALVHGSTSGGLLGRGVGGTAGGGDAVPGAGGSSGAGSHPPPLGGGDGDWLDLDTSDPRLVPYFRRVHAKVDPLWVNAFPRSAMLELKQGTVILEFSIASDGTAKVSWPPARPSGIDEFDRNCADALRRASPFDPIPRELGVRGLHVRAPFVAVNPIVR
jgi:TonB family protein